MVDSDDLKIYLVQNAHGDSNHLLMIIQTQETRILLMTNEVDGEVVLSMYIVKDGQSVFYNDVQMSDVIKLVSEAITRPELLDQVLKAILQSF
jgi:hypothetical protein